MRYIKNIFYIIFILLLNITSCSADKNKSDNYSLEVSNTLPLKADFDDNLILTTICEVKNGEELFVGKQLVLTAVYETNMRHGSFLRDKNCDHASYRVGYYNENIDESIVKFNEAQKLKFIKPLELRVINVQIIGQLVTDESEDSINKKKYDIKILKIISYSYPEKN